MWYWLAAPKQPTSKRYGYQFESSERWNLSVYWKTVACYVTRSIKNDTEKKVVVKPAPGIDEFEGGDYGEEDQDGSDEYVNGGVLEEVKEKRVLHARYVSRVHAMK